MSASTTTTTTTTSIASSSSSSSAGLPDFDPTKLSQYNAELASATPQEILTWSIEHLGQQNLFQTTAFGLTGLAATDMISRISKKKRKQNSGEGEWEGEGHLIKMIFIDTLYHFKETLKLIERVEKKYGTKVNVFYPPEVSNVEEFEEKYGKELWKTDEDTYDYLVKVEPARRAYAELNVKAVITGRRRSQGADRSTLEPLEIDSTGLIKVNPLCKWSFDDVKSYIDMAGVPYNELLDQGYKSVGDWHSTNLPTTQGDERSGRWSDKKGTKTECGLHKDYFKMKKAFEKKKREQELAEKDKARGDLPEDQQEVSETSIQLSELSI